MNRALKKLFEDEKRETCQWAFYKGLFHSACCHFLTTSDGGGMVYTHDEIPDDMVCTWCGLQIEQIDRKFGRRRKAEPKIDIYVKRRIP